MKQHLLSGLLYCGECGEPEVAHASVKPYYQCGNPACRASAVDADIIDPLVWDTIWSALEKQEYLRAVTNIGIPEGVERRRLVLDGLIGLRVTHKAGDVLIEGQIPVPEKRGRVIPFRREAAL